MALRLRRGTNAQRLGITFAEGELVYTTDTKKLYIGDASAAGGNLVSGMNNVVEDATPQLGGNLDLNGNNITGTGNINITGTLSIATGFLKTDIQGSVFADDSGILVDGIAGKLVLSNNALGDLGNVAATAPTDGQVLKWNNSASQWQPQADSTGTQLLNTLTDVNAGSPQNLQALVWDSGTSKWIAGDVLQQGEFLDGDFRGSVFGDDSTLIVDGISNAVTASSINTNAIGIPNTGLNAKVTQDNSTSIIFNIGRNKPGIYAGQRENTSTVLANDGKSNTLFVSSYKDQNGQKISAVINFYDNLITFGNHPNGLTPGSSSYEPAAAELVTISSTAGASPKLGIGTKTPAQQLDVTGNGKFAGFVQFGSYTTAQRNALTAADGMVIYHTGNNKFQGRANGAWVDLH